MKNKILVTLSITSAVFLFGLQLYVSNKLATVGAELTDVQQETVRITQENEQLKHTIASHSSLLVVSQRAKELGFTNAEIRYLERPPFAYNKQ